MGQHDRGGARVQTAGTGAGQGRQTGTDKSGQVRMGRGRPVYEYCSDMY